MRSPPVSESSSAINYVCWPVSLAFFFVAVPVGVAIWDYYGFLVCCDGLYFFLG
jgi:hypothetical protein